MVVVDGTCQLYTRQRILSHHGVAGQCVPQVKMSAFYVLPKDGVAYGKGSLGYITLAT